VRVFMHAHTHTHTHTHTLLMVICHIDAHDRKKVSQLLGEL